MKQLGPQPTEPERTNNMIAINQPGPLSAGSEYPPDAAWEAFFSACWDAYDEMMRRREASQLARQRFGDPAQIGSGLDEPRPTGKP
jgi:hypothetical protein